MSVKVYKLTGHIRMIGNSKGIIIPADVIERNSQQIGDAVELIEKPGSLTINFVTPKIRPRKGGK